MNHASRLGIAVAKQLIQLLLADLFAGRIAEWILAHLADPFAPVVEDRLKCALAGTIADKTIGRAQLGVVRVYSAPWASSEELPDSGVSAMSELQP
jgi:hypothetical protein